MQKLELSALGAKNLHLVCCKRPREVSPATSRRGSGITQFTCHTTHETLLRSDCCFPSCCWTTCKRRQTLYCNVCALLYRWVSVRDRMLLEDSRFSATLAAHRLQIVPRLNQIMKVLTSARRSDPDLRPPAAGWWVFFDRCRKACYTFAMKTPPVSTHEVHGLPIMYRR